MKDNPEISVIFPVHNEQDNLIPLHAEIKEVLGSRLTYELIFVDDGSKDNSYAVLAKIAAADKKVRVVRLLSNYGQSSALAAGISISKGAIIVTMDSDRQHDPRDILRLVGKVKEGVHVVCGWRKDRGNSDSFFKKTIPSKLSNAMIKILTGVRLNDSTGGMRAFSRRVVEVIPLYGEMHRYLPLLATWKGFKVTELPITIRKRVAGKTKYTFKRIFRGFFDLITISFFVKYSTRPLHIFGTIGIFSLLSGFAIGSYYLYQKFFLGIHLLYEVASLILTIMLVLLGMMFLGFGLIADMISYDAITSQKRESYLIEEVIN